MRRKFASAANAASARSCAICRRRRAPTSPPPRRRPSASRPGIQEPGAGCENHLLCPPVSARKWLSPTTPSCIIDVGFAVLLYWIEVCLSVCQIGKFVKEMLLSQTETLKQHTRREVDSL